LISFAKIDGQLHGPGHVFSRAAGDAMPERVQTPERVGTDDSFEMRLKCSPLFEEIENHIHKTNIPLMSAGNFIVSSRRKSDPPVGDQ
jgi:hypothetical protein